MRIVLTSAAVLLAGGIVLGLGAQNAATAGPLPAMSNLSLDASAVQNAGWRERYYRRHGVWPSGPRRAAQDDVVVTTDGAAVIVAPLRPRSCGEYHYWNGVACVDARYNDPDLGPK